jgi:hypothetical protein
MKVATITLMLALAVISCAPTRSVIPVREGEHIVSIAGGGPLITYSDLVIPVPLLSVSYGYGLDSHTNIFGGAQITSALFGVIQADLGARYHFWEPEDGEASISLGLALNPMIDVWEGNFKLWPEILSASRWKFGSHNPYISGSSWIELASTRAHGQKQVVRFVPSLAVGDVYRSPNWDYALELRWIGPGYNNEGVVAEYHGISDNGAFGLYFSVGRRFGL